jgi:hypothetical protein
MLSGFPDMEAHVSLASLVQFLSIQNYLTFSVTNPKPMKKSEISQPYLLFVIYTGAFNSFSLVRNFGEVNFNRIVYVDAITGRGF